MFPGSQGYMPPPAVLKKIVYGEVTAAAQITHGGCMSPIIVLKIQNTTGAGITITANPIIEPGKFDGQILYLECDKDTLNSITFTDEATDPGSQLRLTAATVIMNARDTMWFNWNAEESSWYLGPGGRTNNL